jgi:hypothetical protein
LSPAIPAAATTRTRPVRTIATRIGGAKASHFQPTARRRAKKRPIAPWRIGSSMNFQERPAIAKMARTWMALPSRVSGGRPAGPVRTMIGVCQR